MVLRSVRNAEMGVQFPPAPPFSSPSQSGHCESKVGQSKAQPGQVSKVTTSFNYNERTEAGQIQENPGPAGSTKLAQSNSKKHKISITKNQDLQPSTDEGSQACEDSVQDDLIAVVKAWPSLSIVH